MGQAVAANVSFENPIHQFFKNQRIGILFSETANLPWLLRKFLWSDFVTIREPHGR